MIDMLMPVLLVLPASAVSGIMLGLMIGVIITALFFMVGYGLQHPPTIALAKEELSVLILSVIIIWFWITSDAVLNQFTLGFLMIGLPSGSLPPASPMQTGLISSHIQISVLSLDVMFAKLKELYISLYLYEALIGFLSTVSFPFGSPLPSISVLSISLMPFDGLVLLSNAHTVIVETIGTLITLVWAKQFILLFSKDVIPSILLPMGLVMRAIPFLRKTGSSIIAVCIAGYFIFPIAILFSDYLIFDAFHFKDVVYSPEHIMPYNSPSTSGHQAQVAANLVKSQEEAAKFVSLFKSNPVTEEGMKSGYNDNPLIRILVSVKNVLVGVAKTVWGFAETAWDMASFAFGFTGDFFFDFSTNPIMPTTTSAGLFYFVIDEVANVSQFLVLILVTTLIEIIFTITMYRNISLLIGGEAELLGVTKLV